MSETKKAKTKVKTITLLAAHDFNYNYDGKIYEFKANILMKVPEGLYNKFLPCQVVK